MAKVLLADDEEAIRLMLGRQLRRANHEVTLAEDGMAALEQLKQETFDLVVSDMKMPRLDGMGLLAKAKELAPDTEFIILTGHGNLENAVEAFKTGNVFDYLLKPLDDIHELNAVVARAIERRQLRADNARLVAELQSQLKELEEARQQLLVMAERDGLTGLLNHRATHNRLHEVLASQHDTTIIMIDMDSFKALNDTYGHPVGDRILQHIAQVLVGASPSGALVGRCGGDEFMIILPDCAAAEGEQVAMRIRQELGNRPFINPEGDALPLRLCFGIADTKAMGHAPHSLVAAADAALYESKRKGGNTVTLHLIDLDTQSPEAAHNAYTVLEGLVTAINHKDHYTRAHSEHMTGFAIDLAHALGCSKEILDVVRVAGLLHDIGKIGVPDAVLRKPGRLTPEEYEIMKSHVTLSAAIIHGLPHLADILDAVAHHHERWDGKGYPYGLAGEQIPLLGRVLAVADAFSAMTLDRPYRAGMELEAALTEIERNAGTQFDPELARLFVQTMRAQARAQSEPAPPQRKAA
jgi:diguanylate cyclase (GGDEF)-like protein/putative nucleotidyltransferase with HDIG domain